LNAGIVADYQGRAAASRSSHDAQRLAVGTHIPVDRGIRPCIRHVNSACKQGVNGRWASVEGLPIDLRLLPHSSVEPAIRLADHGLRMRDVGKSANANYGVLPERHADDVN